MVTEKLILPDIKLPGPYNALQTSIKGQFLLMVNKIKGLFPDLSIIFLCHQ